MISIIFALLFSTLIMVTFKLFERFRIDTIQAITVNYLVAVTIGILSYQGEIKPAEIIALPWIINGLIIGCFFILVFFVFATSARKVGIAITAVSSKMSVVIPVIIGVTILKNDTLTALKITGIIIALVAFYLTFKKKERIDLKKRYFLLPVLLFLGNGTNDSMMSYTSFSHQINELNQTPLLLIIIFGTALIIGIMITLSRSISTGEPFMAKNFAAGVILGFLNYYSTYYFFKSLDLYPNSVFFPVFNAGIVSLSALVGYIVFREQLRLVNWLGIVLAIIAILIIVQ